MSHRFLVKDSQDPVKESRGKSHVSPQAPYSPESGMFPEELDSEMFMVKRIESCIHVTESVHQQSGVTRLQAGLDDFNVNNVHELVWI
ncbi:hypothetical protein OJAV_G00061410 [Oryzias javanicus]|uniref:Uncharacterized protein n=1 Tax=Oryzias javanicus TaxID=123683 RepID=A0A437D4T6_ORYJA|nr:hypothetical protein OJAV_G00061410 [Oryzias javanicus]